MSSDEQLCSPLPFFPSPLPVSILHVMICRPLFMYVHCGVTFSLPHTVASMDRGREPQAQGNLLSFTSVHLRCLVAELERGHVCYRSDALQTASGQVRTEQTGPSRSRLCVAIKVGGLLHCLHGAKIHKSYRTTCFQQTHRGLCHARHNEAICLCQEGWWLLP